LTIVLQPPSPLELITKHGAIQDGWSPWESNWREANASNVNIGAIGGGRFAA
jgi:hypothetical protein